MEGTPISGNRQRSLEFLASRHRSDPSRGQLEISMTNRYFHDEFV